MAHHTRTDELQNLPEIGPAWQPTSGRSAYDESPISGDATPSDSTPA